MKITGAHTVLYSRDADADRAFLRDVLQFSFVDAGHGWLIFALPPGEVAVHPADVDDDGRGILTSHLYLMCDDLNAVVASLEEKSVSCGPVHTERWGLRTSIRLPSGGEIGLYQPSHPVAIGKSARA